MKNYIIIRYEKEQKNYYRLIAPRLWTCIFWYLQNPYIKNVYIQETKKQAEANINVRTNQEQEKNPNYYKEYFEII